ncbi:hypothetical protein KKE06_04230 [Candidatus Micrarchaeota archaeon]|nr:hypothetical protein [Candidatus Micrarchaeota archaeon]MBU1930762.1 hypothetical protein [Candidatus Micrarchaeota archaeon]
MSLIVTWMLGTILVLGLLLILMEWTRQSQKKPFSLHTTTQTITAAQATPSTTESTIRTERIVDVETIPSFLARLHAVEQKTRMAHERIQRVEKIMSQLPIEALEKGLDISALEQKVERLIIAKNEMHIQLAALEESFQQQNQTVMSPKITARQLDDLEKELREQNNSLRALEATIPNLAFNRKNKRN